MTAHDGTEKNRANQHREEADDFVYPVDHGEGTVDELDDEEGSYVSDPDLDTQPMSTEEKGSYVDIDEEDDDVVDDVADDVEPADYVSPVDHGDDDRD